MTNVDHLVFLAGLDALEYYGWRMVLPDVAALVEFVASCSMRDLLSSQALCLAGPAGDRLHPYMPFHLEGH
jgi:hypothetical protein